MKHPLQARLAFLYGTLLVLAGAGFSPVGFDRYTVWVQLKLTGWGLSFVPLLLLAASVLRDGSHRERSSWLTRLPMWAAAILAVTIGASAVLTSSATGWLGYTSLPEGALFHLSLCSAFLLVAWLGSQVPPLRRAVVTSVLLVAVVTSILAIPQKFDWRMDYVFSREADVPYVDAPTASGVFRDQSPNSLFWHRGHLGIVAAIGLIVACDVNLRRWGGAHAGAASTFAVVVTAVALVISDTRAPQLAGAIGVTVLWLAAHRFGHVRERVVGTPLERWKWFFGSQLIAVAAGVLIGMILSLTSGGGRGMSVVGLVSGQAGPTDVLTNITGRAYPWGLAWTAWLEKPLFGHGFFHFHHVMANDIVAREIERGAVDGDTATRMQVHEASVQVLRDDGSVWSARLWGTKPHNFVLEHLVNMGLIGTIAVLLFYGSIVVVSLLLKLPGALAVTAGWLVYLWFWYESIQYSPTVWVLLATLTIRAGPEESPGGTNARRGEGIALSYVGSQRQPARARQAGTRAHD